MASEPTWQPVPVRPPGQLALDITPFNSMPSIDPIPKPVNVGKLPSLVYLPSQLTEEERGNILDATTWGGAVLTGSAAIGTIGPVVGKMDISESEDTYFFRVSIPGVAKEDFSCDVAPTGKIIIKGKTTTGEKFVFVNSMKFEMLSQNLCPPGPFSVSFQLPGPVDPQGLSGHFGIDGIFEGIVKKQKPST